MTLSTAITLTMVFKKFARRGTLSIRSFRKTTMKKEESSDDSGTSSYSSEEKVVYNDTEKAVVVSQLDEVRSASPIVPLKEPLVPSEDVADQQQLLFETEITTTVATTTDTFTQCDDDKTSVVALEPVVRDFAYPESSPLHYGRPTATTERKSSVVSLSSSEFTGRQAHALYDFVPETEYEIGMKAGEILWVQYRQSPGWLIADVQDETGLIPESYVEFI